VPRIVFVLGDEIDGEGLVVLAGAEGALRPEGLHEAAT
jgi:NADPH-dependent glutamate synthase beta subunit-like oxidoreductase